MTQQKEIPTEGSPLPTTHSHAEWQALRASLQAAPDATLNELVERYAWNVVWPSLDVHTRRQRIAALAPADKRLLLDQMFARMIEKLADTDTQA